MTRIALFADLHANLPALEAILQKTGELGVDRIISLGDTIAIGPHPGECLEIIRRRNVECVMGNHEEYQVKQISSAEHPQSMSDGEIAHQIWTGKQLENRDRAFLSTLPYRIEERIEGLSCLFLHISRCLTIRKKL
ncbi:MAG: metallophosphoesterase [Spirochaetales bacterium]|nr:metallophosphoesterase [Spirochaetales bacterium]